MLDNSSVLVPILESTTPAIVTASLHTVVVGRVGTYIYDREMSKTDSNRLIVFPMFVSHWAIMVFDQFSPNMDGHVYHLTFHERATAQLSPPTGTSRMIKFTGMTMDTLLEGIKWVGM